MSEARLEGLLVVLESLKNACDQPEANAMADQLSVSYKKGPAQQNVI